MRWQSVNQEGVFNSSDKKNFYMEMSKKFLSEDWLRFYSLSVNNHYVAHQFCFEYQNKLYLLQEGLHPDWFKNGAGNALRAFVFLDCIDRNVDVYDFLAGITQHKLSWGGKKKTSFRIALGSKKIKNKIFFISPNIYQFINKLVKAILSDEMIRKIKNLCKMCKS
jgi:CelD/BcsL family acetyltransferase involved in cellulose biosynthesis